ncbi:MAG: 2,3-diaminopropionate biosynthesis protein SbnB, partial [Cyclobacteriaceae bacterium]
SVINTPIVSGIRTSAVTGALIRKCFEVNPPEKKLNFGIIGFGPIGQLHLQMINALFGDLIEKVRIYDLRSIDESKIPEDIKSKVEITKGWEEVYNNSDVFITCTVSAASYIGEQPPKGSLQLNVSLRDYKTNIVDYIDKMVVDDWDEICRENTDVENMHKEQGLKKEDTINISEALIGDGLNNVGKDDVIMFNPMGMAIFDMAIGKMFYEKAKSTGEGVALED